MVKAITLAPVRPNLTLAYTMLVFELDSPAMPLPVSVECCGLVVALSVNVSVALCAPTDAGAKVTPSVQFVLWASVIGIAPQVPVPLSEYSGSEGTALETVSG